MNAKALANYCATPVPVEPPAVPPESPNLGIVGENLFYSFLPDSPDNCIVIFDTGGWAPDPDLSRRDPTFQFLIRAVDYDTAVVMAQQIFDYFHGKQLFTIGTELVQKVVAMQSAPSPVLGRDENGRERFTINFTFTVH